MNSPSNDLNSVQVKLLETTERLIYSGGIHATGMDAIVKASGVARKSIYHHYPNKEALITATLHMRHERFLAWFIQETSQTNTPEEKLLSIFPALKSWFESEEFNGCAFINATGEAGTSLVGVRDVARLHKQHLLNYLYEITQQCEFPYPEATAKQLLILIDGSTVVAMVSGDVESAVLAGEVAMMMIHAQITSSSN